MGAAVSGRADLPVREKRHRIYIRPCTVAQLHTRSVASLHRCSVAPLQPLQPLGPAEDRPTAPKDNRRVDRQPPYIHRWMLQRNRGGGGLGAIAMQDASTNPRSFATRKAGPRRVRGGCGRSTQQGASTHRAPRTCAGTCPTPKGYYGVLTVPLERLLALARADVPELQRFHIGLKRGQASPVSAQMWAAPVVAQMWLAQSGLPTTLAGVDYAAQPSE